MYWHINLWPCNNQWRWRHVPVSVLLRVPAPESAFLRPPSPSRHCWVSSSVLTKPHHAFPNESEVAKAWGERKHMSCYQLLNLVISYCYVWPFSYPSVINPTDPLRPSSFSIRPALISLSRIHISVFWIFMVLYMHNCFPSVCFYLTF